MATLASVIQYGTAASMPTAAIPGRLYFTSDTEQIFYDTGTAWQNVTPLLSAASISAIQQEKYVYAADTGAVNALAVSLSPAPTIVAGSLVVVKVANTNTGASTIAVNGGTATAITKEGSTALSGGEMKAGQIIFLAYDGTEYQLIGAISSGGGGGTVTSVAVAVPSRQSVSGSPITSSGTITISDNNESANEFFAGPSSGSAAAPGFRTIVAADLPVATTSALGAVKPDGTTITISGGVISSSGGGGGITAQFGTANPNGVNTPAYVQSNSAGNATSVTTSSSVTSGNLLVVVAYAPGATGVSVSDTLGTSFTAAVNNVNGMYIWVGLASSSGTDTATISGTSLFHPNLGILEFSNATVNLDGTAQTGSGSGTTSATLNLTATLAEDLLIALECDGRGGGTASLNSGWTSAFYNTGGGWNNTGVGYQIAATVGNYSSTWTLSSSFGNDSAMLALKANSSPISGSEGDLYFQTGSSPYVGWVYHNSQWNQIQ